MTKADTIAVLQRIAECNVTDQEYVNQAFAAALLLLFKQPKHSSKSGGQE